MSTLPDVEKGHIYQVGGNTLLCSTVEAPGLFAMLGEVTGRRNGVPPGATDEP